MVDDHCRQILLLNPCGAKKAREGADDFVYDFAERICNNLGGDVSLLYVFRKIKENLADPMLVRKC